MWKNGALFVSIRSFRRKIAYNMFTIRIAPWIRSTSFKEVILIDFWTHDFKQQQNQRRQQEESQEHCYVMLCYCYVQNYHHHLCSLWTSLLETLRCAFSCRDINPAPGPTSAHWWMWIGWSRMMLYINNLIVLAFTQPCHGVYAALAVWLVQLTSSARKISWPGTSLFKKVLFRP